MKVRPLVYGTSPPFVLVFDPDWQELHDYLVRAGIDVHENQQVECLCCLVCPDVSRAALNFIIELFIRAQRPPPMELACAAAASGCYRLSA